MAFNWFSPKHGLRRREESAPPHNDSSVATADTEAGVSWAEVVRQLGQEVAMSLNAASEHLERLNRLEPSLVRSLAPIAEAVEKARQAGMSAQHVLRLREDPPPQQRELLNLADVVRAVLTARADWLAQRQINVRKGLAQARAYADSSLLYALVDELVQWAGQMAANVTITVDKSSRTGRPRLRVAAWCDPSQVPEPVWRSIRWTLWHQLAHAVGAASRMDTREDHVRVTLHLAPVSDEQLATAIETSVGPSSVSAVIQGCRVLIISAQAQRRAQCLQALAGYGLILDAVEDMRQAERLTAQQLPDAVIYDASVSNGAIEQLREELQRQAGTPTAFVEIHDQAGAPEFHASTIGAVSTGHVAAGALSQSLGPALVFELCKVM